MDKKRGHNFFRKLFPLSGAKELVKRLTVLGMTVSAAESCTAGLAAALIARIPGASGALWGSFVSYTPEAKVMMLGVGRDILDQYGAVSRETACAMAEGAMRKSGCCCAFSVTGIAGPGGDGSHPAGTVWIATARQGERTEAALYHFRGTRNRVRRKAAKKALEKILERITI